MSASTSISNISLSQYRTFLTKAGCKLIGTEGGHEKWVRKDLTRPIIVQTHVDPVPEFIVRNGLRNLGITKKTFLQILHS